MKTLLLALLVCSALSYASAEDHPLKVTLLGTGVPDPDPDRFGASVLVEAGDEKLLFDCGRGATVRLKQIGIMPDQIDAVFLNLFGFRKVLKQSTVFAQGMMNRSSARMIAMVFGAIFFFLGALGILHYLELPPFAPTDTGDF